MPDEDQTRDPAPTAEPEQAPAPMQDPEPEPKPDFAEQFNEIKKTYEEKLTAQKADFDRQIKERDEVIKQLIKGEPAIMPKGLAPEEHESYIDKINAKRVFKW